MFRTLLISLCLTSTALATTWTVDDDGKADFDNIQAAVDAASDGDEIVVMEGMYYEHDINTLGKSILIEGSINTAGELLAVVHGNWQGSVFVCDSGETTSTVLKNLLITGGNALSGSGMYIEESAPSLVGCTFMNNYAIKGLGGGMHNWGSSPTLTNCTFTGNAAGGSGGGMYNNYNSSPTLTNCTFTNNFTPANGGGMHNSYSSPTLTDCTFSNNNGGIGGGMCNHYSNTTLTNCTFTNNFANSSGGGMYKGDESNPTLTDTTVCGNTPDQIYGDWTDNGGNWVADECPSECPDINGDGIVNVSDLLTIIDQWGLTNSPADVNDDGTVNVSDLLIVIGNWGPCE